MPAWIVPAAVTFDVQRSDTEVVLLNTVQKVVEIVPFKYVDGALKKEVKFSLTVTSLQLPAMTKVMSKPVAIIRCKELPNEVV